MWDFFVDQLGSNQDTLIKEIKETVSFEVIYQKLVKPNFKINEIKQTINQNWRTGAKKEFVSFTIYGYVPFNPYLWILLIISP